MTSLKSPIIKLIQDGGQQIILSQNISRNNKVTQNR